MPEPSVLAASDSRLTESSAPVALDYAVPQRLTNVPALVGGFIAVVAFITAGIGLFSYRSIFMALLSIPVAITAIVLGHAGQRIARERSGKGRSAARFALVAGTAVLLMLVMMIPVHLMAERRAKERANRLICANNLMQVGTGLAIYAYDHGGILPPDLACLISDANCLADIFICPSSSNREASGATAQQTTAAFRADMKRHCSYVFVTPAAHVTTGFDLKVPADTVLAYESLHHHQNEGINILLADGSVQWLNNTQATAVLADLSAGKNPPPSLSTSQ